MNVTVSGPGVSIGLPSGGPSAGSASRGDRDAPPGAAAIVRRAQRLAGRGPVSILSSFQATRDSRVRQGGHGARASGQGHRDLVSLDGLIRDCQDAARNNYFCRSILSAIRNLTIGGTPAVEPRSVDAKWNDQARRVFTEWAEVAEVTGQVGLWDLAGAATTGWESDGTQLVHKVLVDELPETPIGSMLGASGASVPLRLELIEALRLRNPNGLGDSETHKGGIEIDGLGRPVAAWVADWNAQGTSVLFGSPRRVPLDECYLLNNPRLQMPGVYRTEPGLASAIGAFETIDASTTAAFAAYEVAACLALIWMRNDPLAGGIGEQVAGSMVESGEATTAERAHQRGTIEPLTHIVGEVGETVAQLKPEHPSAPFQAMMLDQLRIIASSLDVPMGAAFAYFIRNYHASRSELSVMWPRIERRQRVLKGRFLVPLYREVIALAVAMGILPEAPEGWDRVEVRLGSMPVLDEATDVETLAKAVSAGFVLPEEARARLTGDTDFDGFAKKYIEQTRMLREAGITPGAMPATQTVSTDGERVDDIGDPDAGGGKESGGGDDER